MNIPNGLRLHIGIFGRRNMGKSSLLNLMNLLLDGRRKVVVVESGKRSMEIF